MLSWLPETVSTYGPTIDRIFRVIYYVTGATFFLVQGTLLLFVIIYRHREGRRATYTHGNTALEIAWTIAPAVILVILGVVSNQWWRVIKASVPPTDFHVQITAKQFNWEILYPGPDGKFDTADDVKLDNDLYVPVHKVVRVILKSRDVIHSFFLPNLRLKQDAVPGREIDVWFEATKTGKYEMPCAELCGFGHSGMKGWLFVVSDADYRCWAVEKRIALADDARPVLAQVAGDAPGLGSR